MIICNLARQINDSLTLREGIIVFIVLQNGFILNLEGDKFGLHENALISPTMRGIIRTLKLSLSERVCEQQPLSST